MSKSPRHGTARRSRCPISIALELFGDPWTLLIVRDLMFKGCRRFQEFLEAGEGIATNVLSDRLARLETSRLVTRSADPDDARRVLYGLTPRGADLAPILVEMVIWSARHEDTDAPPREVREMRLHRERVIARAKAPWR